MRNSEKKTSKLRRKKKNLKRYLPKYLKDDCTSPSSCKPAKLLTKFLVYIWVNALSRKMTLTVALKTTTELNIITVVKPVYMTHYYVQGNDEITNEKEKRKLTNRPCYGVRNCVVS